MIVDALAFLLFLLPVPGWVATVILCTAAWRKPRIAALTERAATAVILSIGATLIAFLGSAHLARRTVDPDMALGALAIACVLVSVPSMLWLAHYIRGDFGRDGS